MGHCPSVSIQREIFILIYFCFDSDYNVGAESTVNQPTATSSPITTAMRKNSSPNVEHRDLSSQTSHSLCDRSSVSVEQPNDNNNSLYQNFDIAFPNSTYNNRETLICDESLNSVVSASAQRELTENYYNFVAIANDANPLQEFERSNSMRTSTHNEANRNDTNGLPTPNHGRTQSLTERKSTSTLTRKIPEMLKLNDTFSNGAHPSPSLSASSGPYIAISECITGNPLIDRENPMTPLNSLNPKFYETPRSHINNIGLNLTNDQPYSPKRNNCPTVSAPHARHDSICDQTNFAFMLCRVNRFVCRVALAPVQPIRKVCSQMTKNGHIRSQPKPAAIENYARPIVRSKTMRSCSRTHTVFPSYPTKRMPSVKPLRLMPSTSIRDDLNRSPDYCWKRMTTMNATKKSIHRTRKMHRRPLNSDQKIILRYEMLRTIYVFFFVAGINSKQFLFRFCSMSKKTTIFHVRIICHISM